MVICCKSLQSRNCVVAMVPFTCVAIKRHVLTVITSALISISYVIDDSSNRSAVSKTIFGLQTSTDIILHVIEFQYNTKRIAFHL